MRRRGFRQKPWNKVTRQHKFWVPAPDLTLAQTNESGIGVGLSGATKTIKTNAAAYVVALHAEGLTGQPVAGAISASQRALQHVKLHRFQGDIFVWCQQFDTSPPPKSIFQTEEAGTDGTVPEPDATMLTYAWLKLKEGSNTPLDNGLFSASNVNPRPDQDLINMMMRDDVMKWGNLVVRGITPRYRNQKSVTSGTDVDLSGYEVVNAGFLEGRGVTKIPFPRIPKGGLTLRKGEALVCVAAIWPGPMSASDTNIMVEQSQVSVTWLNLWRCMCSL